MLDTDTTFGAVLKRKRSERGLTQRELAERAGVDASYISQLERDHKFPAARTLEGLAAALEVGVGELLVMYFPPGDESPYYPTIVGRKAQARAFEEALEDGKPGIISYYAPSGYGKTYLIRHQLIPLCRDKGITFIYANGNRVPSYRDFLATLRGKFAAGGVSYKGFDDVFGQCEQIEERLKSRYNDPFSVPVRSGEADAERPFELSYAEKYIYRDMERLLTEEFIVGFAAYLDPERKAVIFINDFDRLSLLSEYWLRMLLRRLSELGLLGPNLICVFVGERPFSAGASDDTETLGVELPAFDIDTVLDYYRQRGVNLATEDEDIVNQLEGHPYSVAAWGDYFEAKEQFNENNLGKAEDILYRLSADLSSRDDFKHIRQGRRLYIELNRRLGRLTHIQGRLAQADEYYGAAEHILTEAGEEFKQELGYVLIDIGTVNRHRGRWQTALDYFNRAEDVFTEIGDELGAAVSQLGAGTTQRLRRRLDDAVAAYNRAIKQLTPLDGDPVAAQWLASGLSNLSIVNRLNAVELYEASEPEEAKKLLKKAKSLCEKAVETGRDGPEAAVAKNRLALCLQIRGQWELADGDAETAEGTFAEALDLHQLALNAFENQGDKYRVAQVESDIGLIDKARGLRYDAVVHFKNSLAYFQQLGSRYHTAIVLLQLGLLSEDEERLSYLGEAVNVAKVHNEESLQEVVAAVSEEIVDDAEREAFFKSGGDDVYSVYREITGGDIKPIG
ncbi:MAG: tetratricopeptide repeat protein [bacterium]|nr:tetratricopeptide repeat protein [bacterium]